MPRMPDRGVRISWLTVASRRDFAALASSRTLAGAFALAFGAALLGDVAGDGVHDEIAGRGIAHGDIVPGIDAFSGGTVHVNIVAVGACLRAEGEAERFAGLPLNFGPAGQFAEHGIGAQDAAVERTHDDDVAEHLMDRRQDFRGFAALPGAVAVRLDSGLRTVRAQEKDGPGDASKRQPRGGDVEAGGHARRQHQSAEQQAHASDDVADRRLTFRLRRRGNDVEIGRGLFRTRAGGTARRFGKFGLEPVL